MKKCPHCGNTDSKLIESNGENATSPHLTLLCVKRVPVDESSFDREVLSRNELIDANDTALCGMQWSPNE